MTVSGDFSDIEIIALESSQAQIRFTGQFQSETVRWNAQIMTLAFYRQTHAQETFEGRRLIDIPTQHGGDQRDITIVLDTAIIDRPTLIKTVIMIRQYKKLSEGRHVFGDPR